jgi:N-acetylmuramoyl-L-alanine amidase
MRIGIDPGHGGSDPGAVSPSGLREADANLDVSLKIAQILEMHGLEVVSTRAEDKYVSLFERVRTLNGAKCDYAVSLHCNASPNIEANYISTFIQGKGGEAEKLAKAIQARLVKATGWPDGGVRVQNLHMTRETAMPAVLVEMGFITNPKQGALLRDSKNRTLLAEAIATGIFDFLGIEAITTDSPLPLASVKVNGQLIGGVNIRGRVYAPVRGLAEALGYEVVWDDKTKTVVIR